MLAQGLVWLGLLVLSARLALPAWAVQAWQGAERAWLEHVLVSWERPKNDTRTVVVEFTLLVSDPTYGTTDRFTGSFRLLRTPTGTVLARYEVTPEVRRRGGPAPLVGLLVGQNVYLMSPEEKRATRFTVAEEQLPCFFERWLNPFIALLNREGAQSRCRLEVAKRDAWYTYLVVEPRSGRMPDYFVRGRVVLLNRGADGIPTDLPRQLWYSDGVVDSTFDIRR